MCAAPRAACHGSSHGWEETAPYSLDEMDLGMTAWNLDLLPRVGCPRSRAQ
jgi:hypothetical protein